jgi:hypothetical protein
VGFLQNSNLLKEQQKSSSAQEELTKLKEQLATRAKEQEPDGAQNEISQLKDEITQLQEKLSTKSIGSATHDGQGEASKLKEQLTTLVLLAFLCSLLSIYFGTEVDVSWSGEAAHWELCISVRLSCWFGTLFRFMTCAEIGE